MRINTEKLSKPKSSIKKDLIKDIKTSNICKTKNVSDRIVFTFENFELQPIKINGEFNNHFKNEKHYYENITELISKTLPEVSREPLNELLESNKSTAFRFHKIDKNIDGVRKILKEYSYPEHLIDDIISGNQLYQIVLKKGVNAPRLIVRRVDNIFSVLFLDTNHHIYYKEEEVKKDNNISYEFWPEYCLDDCSLVEDMGGDCILLDYIDINKFRKSMSYNCDPLCNCNIEQQQNCNI